MTWNDITVEQYRELVNILSVEDDYTIFNVIDYLYNVDCQNLPIKELNKFDVSFLKTQIPEVKLQKYYTINGTKYNSNIDLTKLTVSQFIDYQNYIKSPETKLEDVLSVFFFPEGAIYYNTDYDIIKVKEDLKQLPITVAHSIGFFFKQQLQIFFWIFRFSLIRQVKKIKMDKQKKKELIDNIKKMDLWALVSSLTFLNTVKLPTNQLLM